ncbi:uncharacterized protein CDV56_102528 [Aspergillus thermomutatus]|uniref:Uncharacterized protein n=1 Tax=Aspergillus thermomutatus TaxID=41047 RepID=A0A397FYG7_ASPTH|nr:uncharacterized protein CDV56_102528 [Aspergillus thermomutatus]RHZ43801.1 hypothetical protein CDV56_102528 [Aspergillus thermomutatus]
MPRQPKFKIHKASGIYRSFLLIRPDHPDLPALTMLKEVVKILQAGQGNFSPNRDSFPDKQVGDLIFEIISEDNSLKGLTDAAMQCITQQIENWQYDQDMIRWEQYVEGMVLIDYSVLFEYLSVLHKCYDASHKNVAHTHPLGTQPSSDSYPGHANQLDPLTKDEITLAANLIRQHGESLGVEFKFNAITLREPWRSEYTFFRENIERRPERRAFAILQRGPTGVAETISYDKHWGATRRLQQAFPFYRAGSLGNVYAYPLDFCVAMDVEARKVLGGVTLRASGFFPENPDLWVPPSCRENSSGEVD